MKNNIWLFMTVLLACFLVSVWVRYQQFETWKLTPQAYFVGEKPMMTTLDAPFWLRSAREYNEGTYSQKKWLRGYPESTEHFLEMSEKEGSPPMKFIDRSPVSSSLKLNSSNVTPEISFRNVPLLSVLIAQIAPYFNYNYYLTGTLLVPVLASLFMLPLGIFFFHIGAPVSGLLGGLIGTFAGGYYMRSSIGRIDTDMLNLFFPALTALLILMAGKAKTQRGVMLYAMGAGLSSVFFIWWYSKGGFTFAFFMVLVFSLFIQKIHFRTILIATFLFVLFAKPLTIMDGIGATELFLKGYFNIEDSQQIVIDKSKSQAIFPNTLTTISEADRLRFIDVLRRMLSNTTLNWIGILGLSVIAVFKWRVLFPLLPMLFLGLLSFYSSNRFVMYLAPFIGIGLGWFLQLLVDGSFYVLSKSKKVNKEVHSVAEKTNQSEVKVVKQSNKYAKGLKTNLIQTEIGATTHATSHYLNFFRQATLYLGMFLFFWFISGQTAISFVPRPSIHTGLYATFLEVKKRVPAGSALLTWWDYGFAITDVTGLSTFHDGGGLQQRPSTYFTARGLISNDPVELYDITQYLSTKGNPGIKESNTSPEELLAAVRNPKQKPWDPIYLFFTADMTGKYGAISKIGSWDISKGGSKPRIYQILQCNKMTNKEINCHGVNIDLQAGKINNQVALKRLLFIRDGKVLKKHEFNHPHGYSLQLLVRGNQIVEVQLIDEVVFRSNYNQMFFLGNYREDLYEEIYNAFPFSRLYKFKF